jgi:hypothetical protein
MVCGITVCSPFDPTHYQVKPIKIPHLIFAISILILSYYIYPVCSRQNFWVTMPLVSHKCQFFARSSQYETVKTAADFYFYSSHGSGSEESQARQHRRRTGRHRTSVLCDSEVLASRKQNSIFRLICRSWQFRVLSFSSYVSSFGD